MNRARAMGQHLRTLSIAALAAFAGFPLVSHAVESGAVAPTVSLPGISATVSTSAQPGRWVYVDFWASWCAPCKRSFPWMNAMHAKYQSRGLLIVAVNVDAKRADADRFLKQNPAEFTIAFDPAGETPKRFAVKAMPSAYLIDPSGRVRWVHRGFTDADAAKLDAELDAALSRK